MLSCHFVSCYIWSVFHIVYNITYLKKKFLKLLADLDLHNSLNLNNILASKYSSSVTKLLTWILIWLDPDSARGDGKEVFHISTYCITILWYCTLSPLRWSKLCMILPGPAGVYFVVCMALLVISLTETVLIVRLVHKQDLQAPVPHWVKYLVLERAPVLFCIHKKHRFCARLSSQTSELDRYKENNYGTGKVQHF